MLLKIVEENAQNMSKNMECLFLATKYGSNSRNTTSI